MHTCSGKIEGVRGVAHFKAGRPSPTFTLAKHGLGFFDSGETVKGPVLPWQKKKKS
jgi:hypothetical protein